MKKYITLLAAFAAGFLLYSQTVTNWKGRTTGADYFPKWIASLEKGDETAARKKFNLNTEEKILFATATEKDLDAAKSLAKNKINAMVSEENSVVTVNGLERLFEHWILFDDEGKKRYKVYLVYKIKKD